MFRRRWLVAFVGFMVVFALSGGIRSQEPASPSQASSGTAAENPEKKTDPLPPDLPLAEPVDLEGKVRDNVPLLPWSEENPDEFNAFYLILARAHTTSLEAFHNSARPDVTYAHLMEEPDKYRGQVVHIEGNRLKRVRRFDVPKDEAETYDLPYQYEGWVFHTKVYGANPMVCVFTDLSPGIDIAEDLEGKEIRVSFDGYFFKKYLYKDGQGVNRSVPLLIGHSLVVKKTGPSSGESGGTFSKTLFTSFLGILVLTAGLTIALTWWYRKGDSHIRSRIAEAQPVNLPEPEPFPEDWNSGPVPDGKD